MPRHCPKRPSRLAKVSCQRKIDFIKRAKLAFASLVSLATVLLLFSQAYGGTLCENFNNNQFNSNYFFINTFGTGPTAAVTENRLEITIPSNSSGNSLFAALVCKIKFSGDFDVQVDFNLLNWPAANGINVGIDTDLPSSVHRSSSGSAEDYYLWINGKMTQIPTSDTSGKLRMTRQGNKIEGFYWQNNGWHSIGSFTDPTYGKDLGINISANSGNPSHFSGQLVKSAFDNFRITNKAIPTTGNTFLPLLLD